ncbi:MAG: MCP four helix bundle domain-containing protein, partial [Alcaligenes sp.]
MTWLTGLTVRTKLVGSFLIVAAIAAIVGAVGFRATAHVNTMAATMHDVELAGLDHAATTSTTLVAAGRSIRSALLVRTVQERNKELEKLDERIAKVKAELDVLDDLFVTAAGREMISRARSATHAYEAGLAKVVAALVALEQTRLLGDAAEDLVREMVFMKRQNAQRFANEIANVYTDTVTTLSVMTIAGVLMALVLGWLLTRSLTRQLGGEPAQVAAIASAIAQ